MPVGPDNTSQQNEDAHNTLPIPSVSRASFAATNLPFRMIGQGNLAATGRALGEHLASSNNLFERGSHVVKIVHTPSGYRSQPLNVHSTVNEAHRVCRPVRIVKGNLREP